MQISDKGLMELANYEALSNQPYLDSVGVKTVGVGLTDSDIPDLKSWEWTRTIDNKTCIDLFKKAVKKYSDAVDRALDRTILQHQFDALVSITYNIGIGGMQRSTFMRKVNAGLDPSAAMRMWNKGGGRVIRGLVNRRNYEVALYTTGQYQNDGTVQHIKVNPLTHKPIYIGRVDISQYFQPPQGDLKIITPPLPEPTGPSWWDLLIKFIKWLTAW